MNNTVGNLSNLRIWCLRCITETIVLSLVIVTFFLNGCNKSDPSTELRLSEQSHERQWGVRIEGIRLSAAGYMLDFRYQVTDSQKATSLFGKQINPYLIDEKSGAKLIVPSPSKVGPLKQSSYKPIQDKIYFVMFANPSRLIKPGNRVTVVMGDFKAQGLIVK